MDLNSPLFDRIRLRPAADEPRAEAAPGCQHPGCAAAGGFRAPKGRGRDGQYWSFCLEHVREYNRSYNYFAGMTDEAVQQYQKAATVGHRPTWSMGCNAGARTARRPGDGPDQVDDPLGVFGDRFERAQRPRQEPKIRPSATALKALDTLGLDEGAEAAEIKARYKSLVKKFHPDANGGDRSFETRLQEIIRAYNTLKSIGLG